MINQKLTVENELEKEQKQLIFNTNSSAQLITRLKDGFILDVNDEFSILSGYSKAEVIGSNIVGNSFWKNPDERQFFISEIEDKGFCKNKEFVFQRKDKSLFSGIISGKIITIDSEIHIISVVQDISERKEFERVIIESEEKYRSIINASPDDITITDLEGKILITSPAAKKIFAYDLEFDDFVGMQLLDFIVAQDFERAKSNIRQMCLGKNIGINEYRAIRKDQSIFDIEVKSGLIYNANGLADKMVFIIRDITKRKETELQMENLIYQLEIEKKTAQLNAITDSLTGLFNRGYFDYTFRIEFARLRRSGLLLSLIMLDIDHFKKYNDSYGHLAGDKCIQTVSNILKASLDRASDVVARYGGEEFIIILPETDEEGAKMLGERIRKGVENLAIPHIRSETSSYLTVSVGITTVRPNDFESPDQVLKLVDDALYCAKDGGRNRCYYKSISEN